MQVGQLVLRFITKGSPLTITSMEIPNLNHPNPNGQTKLWKYHLSMLFICCICMSVRVYWIVWTQKEISLRRLMMHIRYITKLTTFD